MIAADRKPEAPLTAGNALYLAKKLGIEHVSDNRIAFNTLCDKLFQGYADDIAQPIDKNWRRMPDASDLFREATEGYLMLAHNDEARLYRLDVYITHRLREVFHEAVPKLKEAFDDPSLLLTQRVVTALMEQRDRDMRAAERANKGFFQRFLSGGRANFDHDGYLRGVTDIALLRAYVSVAEGLLEEVRHRPDSERLHRLIGDTHALLTDCLDTEIGNEELEAKLRASAESLEDTGHVARAVPALAMQVHSPRI